MAMYSPVRLRARRPRTSGAGGMRPNPTETAAEAARRRREQRLQAMTGKGGFVSSRAKPRGGPRAQRPKSAGAFRPRNTPRSRFKIFYERRDLPIVLDFEGAVRKIQWKVDLKQIDLLHYLPIFMDGLREKEEPYHFLAHQGTAELLAHAGDRVVPVIPQLIMPMKTNLSTRDPSIMCAQMRVLQNLVRAAPLAGRALVPYYRQLLQVFNLFITKRVNVGDAFDYGQKKGHIGDLILETLFILEQHGGDDAFVNIKFMIPTYESCL